MIICSLLGIIFCFCGVCSEQISTNRYLCRNKYYGRSLSDDGLRQSLAQFFHNGINLRTEIFAPLLDQLNRLLAIINQLDSFRFFTSSLLIIYDGLEPYDIDVRVIDFAHATHHDITSDSPYIGPDEGFIFGLNNLIEMIEELSKEEWKTNHFLLVNLHNIKGCYRHIINRLMMLSRIILIKRSYVWFKEKR